MAFDAWNYRPDSGWSERYDLTGYQVEATDGRIGRAIESAPARDLSYLVVDTGPWIFGHKVMVPAGTVTTIDHSGRTVYLDRSQEQVRTAPDYDPEMYPDPTYQEKISHYFQSTYAG